MEAKRAHPESVKSLMHVVPRRCFFKSSMRALRCILVVLSIVPFWIGAVAAQQEDASLQQPKAKLELDKLQLEIAKLKDDLGSSSTWIAGVFGMLGAVLGASGSIWVSRRTRFGGYDQSVHDKRLELYPKLIKVTEPLAIHFPSGYSISGNSRLLLSIDRHECEIMGKRLTNWYYDGGGLLLSKETRDQYLRLARALMRASTANEELKSPKMPGDAEHLSVDNLKKYQNELGIDRSTSVERWNFGNPVQEDDKPALRFRDYVFLRHLSSTLRTRLTEDLRSRRRPT